MFARQPQAVPLLERISTSTTIPLDTVVYCRSYNYIKRLADVVNKMPQSTAKP